MAQRSRLDIRPLTRDELPAPAARLARWLIGKTLVRDHRQGRMSGRIVETEAYVVGDASGHAFRGKTARNASLFLERGHAYVYFIYGCWFSLNVSAGRSGTGTGVLLRALEPLEGVALMRRRRPRARRDEDLTNGPAKLCAALGIGPEHNGRGLQRPPLVLRAGTPVADAAVVVTPRIGITRAKIGRAHV